MWALYQAAILVAIGLGLPLLLTPKGRTYLGTLGHRLGRDGPSIVGRPLWIHAVSVGEVAVAKTLVERVPVDLPVLVTTITPTGHATARRLLGDRATVTYLPIDLGWPVRRFLERYQPLAGLIVEGDYWPLLLTRARHRGIELVVVNGRVGDRNARRLRRWPRVATLLAGAVTQFGLRTESDRERLLAAGIPAERLTVTGDLKFDVPTPTPLRELQARIERLADERPILVAGSTRDGEESLVLEAYREMGREHPAMLILAPRHPERWPAVASILDRSPWSWCHRSDSSDGLRPDVVLLDSVGELADCYRYARAAFIGGTLVPRGGHNPLEAALFATPIAVGPSMENFRDVASIFDAEDAWYRVRDSVELAEVWRQCIAEPDAASAVGCRGREVITAHRGATERTLELIRPVLARAGVP